MERQQTSNLQKGLVLTPNGTEFRPQSDGLFTIRHEPIHSIHIDHQQEQIVESAAITDAEATNCSETMSSTNEELEENSNRFFQQAEPLSDTTTTTVSQQQNQQLLRLGHQPTMDSDTTIGSLTSQFQAPPSYGTAMTKCATLDPSELIHQFSISERGIENNGSMQLNSANPLNSLAFASSLINDPLRYLEESSTYLRPQGSNMSNIGGAPIEASHSQADMMVNPVSPSLNVSKYEFDGNASNTGFHSMIHNRIATHDQPQASKLPRYCATPPSGLHLETGLRPANVASLPLELQAQSIELQGGRESILGRKKQHQPRPTTVTATNTTQRRRHKSSWRDRAVSQPQLESPENGKNPKARGLGGLTSGKQVQQNGARSKTISAHCWLIDSSDDQSITYMPSASKTGTQVTSGQTESPTRFFQHSHRGQMRGHMTLARLTGARGLHPSRISASSDHQLQNELNVPQSLLEAQGQVRTTNRSHSYSHRLSENVQTSKQKCSRVAANSSNTISRASMLPQSTLGFPSGARRLTSRSFRDIMQLEDEYYYQSSQSARSCPKSTRSLPQQRSKIGKQASIRRNATRSKTKERRQTRSLLSLSAILSLLSGFIDRVKPPKGESESQTADELMLTTIRAQQSSSSSYNPAMPYAIAASSVGCSSSSSAYATGSSRLSQSSGQQNQTQVQQRQVHQYLASSNPSGNQSNQVQCSRPNDRSISLLYALCSTNGNQQGSHSYEYCDPISGQSVNKHSKLDGYDLETRFATSTGRSPADEKLEMMRNIQVSSSSSSTSSSSYVERRASLTTQETDATASEPSDQFGFGEPTAIRATQTLSMRPSASIEPSASTLSNQDEREQLTCSAPRRFCFRSLADLVPGSSRSRSFEASKETRNFSNKIDTRYKSLARRSSSGRKRNTLDNVISLAKVDRVFRFRLIASMVVSFILCALIALLAYQVYLSRRQMQLSFPFSNWHAGSQRARLSLLIDDSDQDLSWLWTKQPQVSGIEPARTAHNSLVDQSLSQLVAKIERSELLEQFQTTISHLANIQLANDNFIDLANLAQHLHSPPASNDSSQSSDRQTHPQVANDEPVRDDGTHSIIQLNQVDHDLVSLVLLSNLHWPLVKWRHQNRYQQSSVSSFLAFAFPSSFSSSAGASGEQESPYAASSKSGDSLSNLLTLLLLAESIPSGISNSEAIWLQSSLSPFLRLNSLLRRSSFHLISCSYLLGQMDQFQMDRPQGGGMRDMKVKFCQKLINRYRQQMNSLSQLSLTHKQRENPFDSDSSVFEWQDRNREPQSSRSSLIAFLLDRLALLDVQMLAESIAADESWSPNEEDEGNDLSDANFVDQLLRQDESIALPADLSSRLFDRRLAGPTKDGQLSVLELARQVIGENGARLSVDMTSGSSEDSQRWPDGLNYPWSSTQLPQMVSPLNYDLFLHPNLTSRLILGMVKIEFQLTRATNYIILNCRNLNLVDVSVWHKQPTLIQRLATESKGSNQSMGSNGSTLKQVPIRRVLIHRKLEQIYIELHDSIRPSSVNNNSSFNTDQPDDQSPGGLNFGDLPSFISSNGNNLSSANVENNRGLQATNRYVITVSFNKTNLMASSINNSISFPFESGLRFVHYVDLSGSQPEGEVKSLFHTELEPNIARRLFPCFDGTQFKAQFQLNLVHDRSHQALFNAPKRERIPYTSDGLVQMSVFEPTPIPLSAYLVAFVIYDGQSIKSIASRLQTSNQLGSKQTNPIQVQILSQFELLSQAEFASQLVPRLLGFYQTFLQFPYPMEKLDLIALPKSINQYDSTFSSISSSVVGNERQLTSGTNIDTMENLGLIWFKAPLLLMDSNLISQNLIEQISLLISHQLAHQYFGNIVSLRNWSQDLWLYESLCQYLESFALTQVERDWNLDEQFLVTSIQENLASEQFTSRFDEYSTFADSELLGSRRSSSDSSDHFSTLVSLNEASESSDSKDIDTQNEGLRLKLRPPSYAFGQFISSIDPKRGPAFLYMLLTNLLPSQEAQGKLLRRCLSRFQYKTMSRRQFWLQLSHQLNQEDPRLANIMMNLDLQSPSPNKAPDQIDELDLKKAPNNDSTPIERVVMVRASSKNYKSGRQRPLSIPRVETAHSSGINRLASQLESVSNVWLQSRGFPLVTASVYRDRVHLHQERLSIDLSEDEESTNSLLNQPSGRSIRRRRQDEVTSVEDSSGGGGEDRDIWPIPLMFVSRFNPKQARFFWLSSRELEIPFGDHLTLLNGGDHHAISLASVIKQSDQAGNKRRTHLDYVPIEVKRGPSNSWFKLNVNQSSIVRVNYDERNWESLIELLAKSHYSNHVLGPLDRANLIDDAMTLMQYGKVSVAIAMNLTLYLEVGERDYQPWASLLGHLERMQTLLNQNPLWHRYVLKLLQPISSVIGWKDDGTHLMRKLRRSLFQVALSYGDEKAIQKAKQDFKSWLKAGRFIVPNLQELVYVAGVRYGDQQEWFHCWQKYQQLAALEVASFRLSANQTWITDKSRGLDKSNSLLATSSLSQSSSVSSAEPNVEYEKRQLLTALASTQNTWLLEQFLNYSLDSSKIQVHHLKHVMQTLGKNPVARLYLWRFVRLNWATLTDQFRGLRGSEDEQILETMIIESTKHFATRLDLDEVKAFFDTRRRPAELQSNHDLSWGPSVEAAIQRSLLMIRSNIFWREQIEPKLTKWLSSHDQTNI